MAKDGSFLYKWGQTGEKEGQLNRPSGMALDKDNNLIIVDSFNHRFKSLQKMEIIFRHLDTKVLVLVNLVIHGVWQLGGIIISLYLTGKIIEFSISQKKEHS
ncbi:MAG: hypothetical protein CM1200mP8_0400 [Chloroflexota bacterium]|nr:MAG: hypothetical protein CM1200mP8_0400 [Chloroflexota bacterium]